VLASLEAYKGIVPRGHVDALKVEAYISRDKFRKRVSVIETAVKKCLAEFASESGQ